MIAWLLRKLNRVPPPTAPPAAQHEAEEELRRARAKLRESTGEAAQAQEVASTLNRVNKENHFAERAIIALRGIVQ